MARALRNVGVHDVWVCSHIGGDRFAANVVSLPSGVYLGRVPPERAAEMVRDLSDDLIDLDHYRGRSCYSTLVQVLEIDGDDAMARLRRGGSPVEEHVEEHIEVHVRRHRTESFQLSCGGGMAAPWRYEVVDVRSLR